MDEEIAMILEREEVPVRATNEEGPDACAGEFSEVPRQFLRPDCWSCAFGHACRAGAQHFVSRGGGPGHGLQERPQE
eukprot:2504501-Pyramimonas_sp.AAC.1